MRNAVGRRWFEWVLRGPACGTPRCVDLGSKPGGWTIPTGLVESDWLCYCVGAGGDVSFDIALMRDFGVTVRSFDPAKRYVEAALIEVGAGLPFTAYPVALATDDGSISMQLSHEPGSESMSANALYETHRYVQRPGRRLATLMEELGDDRVDLLKVDIEGAEYQVIPELDLHAAGVSVFSVQLHHNGGVRAARRMIDCLRAKGFDLVACRPAVCAGERPSETRAAPRVRPPAARPEVGERDEVALGGVQDVGHAAAIAIPGERQHALDAMALGLDPDALAPVLHPGELVAVLVAVLSHARIIGAVSAGTR